MYGVKITFSSFFWQVPSEAVAIYTLCGQVCLQKRFETKKKYFGRLFWNMDPVAGGCTAECRLETACENAQNGFNGTTKHTARDTSTAYAHVILH